MPNTTSSKQVLLSVKAYGFLILEIVRELTLVELRRTQHGGIEKKVLDCSCVSHGVDIEGCDKKRTRNESQREPYPVISIEGVRGVNHAPFNSDILN